MEDIEKELEVSVLASIPVIREENRTNTSKGGNF